MKPFYLLNGQAIQINSQIGDTVNPDYINLPTPTHAELENWIDAVFYSWLRKDSFENAVVMTNDNRFHIVLINNIRLRGSENEKSDI